MNFFTRFFGDDFYVNWMAALTYLTILVLLGYILYSLNVFKKR